MYLIMSIVFELVRGCLVRVEMNWAIIGPHQAMYWETLTIAFHLIKNCKLSWYDQLLGVWTQFNYIKQPLFLKLILLHMIRVWILEKLLLLPTCFAANHCLRPPWQSSTGTLSLSLSHSLSFTLFPSILLPSPFPTQWVSVIYNFMPCIIDN